MVDITTLEALIGTKFPGGSYRIEPWQSWLTNDCVLAAHRDDDLAHPMYCYYAALAGMGISLDELFALAHATADDGVMFGEADIELHQPLRVGVDYAVRGGFTSAVRKEGKKAGVFDIVGFELEVVDPSGAVVGVSRNSFVFPRREGQAS